MNQTPSNRPRSAVMKRRHSVHEMCHVTSARTQCPIKHVDGSARVADRNNPAALLQFADEFYAALDLWRERYHVDGAVSLNRGQRVNVGQILESTEMLSMKCAALFVVNKWPFVVDPKNSSAIR